MSNLRNSIPATEKYPALSADLLLVMSKRWWLGANVADDLTCPHVMATTVHTACGVFGCRYDSCDECYEGHLLEGHMFQGPQRKHPIILRMTSHYDPATVRRGQWAQAVLHWEFDPTPFND